METGIVGVPAPPLEHVRWINENGDGRSPLTLAELGQGYSILYFFQDWCAGCHAHGFPTFVTLAEEFRDKGVGLAAVQTVFEGSEVNTFDRLRENQRRYGLHVPFGHTVADSASGDAVPAIMEAYRSGGTPWFVVIAPNGRVMYDGFRLDAEGLVQALRPAAPMLTPVVSRGVGRQPGGKQDELSGARSIARHVKQTIAGRR